MIKNYIQESINAKLRIIQNNKIITNIERAADLIVNSVNKGGTIFTAGNGGSAADAQHFAGEFVAKFSKERPGIPAVALTTDSSILTAISNDLGYENIFVRQIQALGKQNDVFFVITTSGTSPNILNAVKVANSLNITTIALIGDNRSPLEDLCNCTIKAPSLNVPVIQEVHIMIEHIICSLVEKKLFNI